MSTYSRVLAAQSQLRGHAHVTPVVTSRVLNERAGTKVYLKCENLQRVGAFKFRGAWNAISRLSDAQKAAGVITFSSGNHAQAVALAARELGIRATVVMPSNAPAIKKAATRGYGATVIEYVPTESDREALAQRLVEEHGYTLIPPYDHEDVIAGAGTAALELLQEVGSLDGLFVCVGGGGLLSGSAIAARGYAPGCKVFGVEPLVANDAALSFRTRQLVVKPNPPTIADGTRTASLGRLTFPLVLENVDDFHEVTEEEIKAAVRFAFYTLKLVVEPSGALGLAAVLKGAARGMAHSGVIVSGGNIDGAVMREILSESEITAQGS